MHSAQRAESAENPMPDATADTARGERPEMRLGSFADVEYKRPKPAPLGGRPLCIPLQR